MDEVNGTNGDYRKIGAQFNVASPVVNNPIHLTLTNGSIWNVTGETNYLADVTLDTLDSVRAESPVTVCAQSQIGRAHV